MKRTTLYAIVVFLEDGMEIYKTTDRKRMLEKVHEVAAERKQYTVLRHIVSRASPK